MIQPASASARHPSTTPANAWSQVAIQRAPLCGQRRSRRDSYAARHPERVGRLALITPSVFAVGLTITGADRRETARLRHDEPWFPAAFAALEALLAGQATADTWQAIAPFSYGRWDEVAQAHQARSDFSRSD